MLALMFLAVCSGEGGTNGGGGGSFRDPGQTHRTVVGLPDHLPQHIHTNSRFMTEGLRVFMVFMLTKYLS